jgi:hypothetical protein
MRGSALELSAMQILVPANVAIETTGTSFAAAENRSID